MDQFYVQLDGFSRQLVHDYEGVMMKVARLGYSGIEIFYGLHGGYSPEGLRDFLKSIGMVVLSSHVDIQDTDQNLDYLPGTGCKYIICPGMAITSREEALQAAEQLNALGERAKAVGMKYGYHNHSNDFLEVDGKMINDILIENTDPDLVAFEIDVAWAYRAGVDAAEYIRKHSGRFELIHVKETKAQMGKLSFMKPPKKGFRMERDISGWPKMTPEQAAEMDKFLSINCELGKGIVDMKAIKAAADAQGFTPYYIVERDYAWTGDIFTTLAADSGYLRAL
ncbi:MAG: sugar phosphate isomerase/epimerase [Lachnospiraceae bacterium]|nr:sugar phosphate isomerase/epimerase [Lachnospiraceae bacterium]